MNEEVFERRMRDGKVSESVCRAAIYTQTRDALRDAEAKLLAARNAYLAAQREYEQARK